ncbi:hypermethylated in cancer 2 protein isoform X3 [Anabrus simplex]|uniref:hypermethylated in cancer 2 protein isoform X3 n=1 Tax=Anabrus simplex TaxID=316456 RepID=UPI0035A38E40
MCRVEASVIAGELGITGFKASRGWLSKFYNRSDLCFQRKSGIVQRFPGVLPVDNRKPIKKLKRGAVSNQKLRNRPLRPNAKRRKRRNPGSRKLSKSIEKVWLPGAENFVNTVRQDSMESGDCPVFFQEIKDPEDFVFKTEVLTEGGNEERVGNPLFETSGEPEAVIVKTEPFTEENASDEQNPATVDALELRIKEEPEDNTVQPESVTVRNMETVVVKEEITFEEPDVHFEESSTEYDFLSSDVRNGDRPWTGGAECPVCGKWFKSDLVVNTHLKNHVDTRRYKCKLCSNKYRHLRNLKLHLESHADKKPIACETCHKLFRSKLALNKHRLAQECVEVASRAVMTNPHMHRERL